MEAQIISPQARELDRVHPEYAAMSDEQKRQRAFDKLQEYINRGEESAKAAVRRILGEVPSDALVPAHAIGVRPMGAEFVVGAGSNVLGHLHPHALDQLATRLGMPTRYMHELQGTEWGRGLVAQNFNELAKHFDPKEKFLVRAVGTTVRGVLSQSYRTEDSRPAVDALIGIAQELDAVVADGRALDTKASIKVMVREPVEVFPGEWAVFGLDYRTSDYGDGGREFCGWILRLLCLNGATTVASYRRVHLGGRLTDEVEYSEATRQLNERASASAARDIGRALLGKEAIRKLVEQVRAANAVELNPDAAIASIRKSVSKDEQKAIVEKYNSPDIVLLPPGNTKWRFSNAISWLANNTADAHRRLELESVAGEFIAA